MKNLSNEKGITLIKLIIIVIVIAALIACFSMILSDDSKNVSNKNNEKINAGMTNEINEPNTKTSPDNTELDIEITTFADASKYKIGDIVTTGTIAIGFVELPDIKIKSPVASKVTTDPALAYSPAYLYGPGLNRVGRTIIVGMVDSYKGIEKLKVGGMLNITDDEEITKEYEIIEIKNVKSDDSSYGVAKDKTNCEVVLSLVYNDNKENRLVIVAEEKQ